MRRGSWRSRGQQRHVRYLARVLDDAGEWGLTAPGGVADGLSATFTVTRAHRPPRTVRGVDEPSRALPRAGVRQLLAPASLHQLDALAGGWAVNWFKLALTTGRRPGEVCLLPLQGLPGPQHLPRRTGRRAHTPGAGARHAQGGGDRLPAADHRRHRGSYRRPAGTGAKCLSALGPRSAAVVPRAAPQPRPLPHRGRLPPGRDVAEDVAVARGSRTRTS